MFEDDKSPVVGLRVDVDTLRGTRRGVPKLLESLEKRGIRASFFFSVGPDNMGRHLWRLARPKFLLKMIRSNAASLYGWDIILRGLFWPGPSIGRACASQMQATAAYGHEVGVHAWDHHKWQAKLDAMSSSELDAETEWGVAALREILGRNPDCSASPGWRCNDAVLACQEKYDMKYHSDCRGVSVFRPVIYGAVITPQIPVTMQTYDELIGQNGVTDSNYNALLLDQVNPRALNVLTIHAEVEGIAKSDLFEDFLNEAAQRGITFVPLGELLPALDDIPPGTISEESLYGREGVLCVQAA